MTKLKISQKTLFFAFTVTTSFAFFFYGVFCPSLNWDIIGYVASAYHAEGIRDKELHEKTFSDISTTATAEQIQNLTEGNEYRHIVATAPESLTQHLPFYSIRMAYIYLIRAVGHLSDTPYSKVTYLIAAFFGALAGLCLSIFYEKKSFTYALSFPLILYVAGFPELVTLSTPDSLAAFLALAAWALYQYRPRWTILPLLLLPLVRTDYILLAGIFAVFSFEKKQRLQALLFATLPFAIYIFVNKTNFNYGYLKIFNFTLINIDPYPANLTIHSTWTPYLQAYVKGFRELIGHGHFIIYVIYGAFWYKYIRPKNIQRFNQQITLVLGFVVLHMLLFPAYYQRFFAWCAAIASTQLFLWLCEFKKMKSEK